MKNKRLTGGNLPTALGFGWLCSLILALCGVLIVAALVLSERLEQERMIFGILIVQLFTVFLGAFTGAGVAQERKILAGILTGICYFLTLLCITAVLFEGRYENVWTTAILLLGCSCAAGFVRMRKRRGNYAGVKRRTKFR